jgi:hypothetical protein
MNRRQAPFQQVALSAAVLLSVCAGSPRALDYPGTAPGKATCSKDTRQVVLENGIIRGEWKRAAGKIGSLTVVHKGTGQTIDLPSGFLPRIVLDDGSLFDPQALVPTISPRLSANAVFAAFGNHESGLSVRWIAELDNGANAIVQTVRVTARSDTKIKEIVFVDTPVGNARQVGSVDGSVVVCDDVFIAVEHPLAENTVGKDAHVRCSLPRGNELKATQSWTYGSAIGVVPPGQLRRGFLHYLEQRRVHPYRPFLHYNSWYHLNIGRPDNHMTEAECLATIEHIGRELITKRGVKMDAFVWDDGWDNFNSLWGFHKDFPDGFKKLKAAGDRYGAAQGVWMSPWGGYGAPKQKRIAYGKAQGYETNPGGFSMAGPEYRAAFRDVCLKMMRENGVKFFKFDGMGAGNSGGADSEHANDVDAVLELTRELRREDPDVFISATVGTWASPFWVLYADSIWRQGGDTGFHGQGNERQKWITYRDMFCYRSVVRLGPLYPLNSLMLHGVCIGDRTNPAKMDRDEKSVADEIWTFFGSGTDLQELYISPELLTATMWDELAAAAKWSRTNTDVLVDTHWIGGDPGLGDVYGWASWQPRGGIVVLRNPSDKPATYNLEPARDFELPDAHLTDYQLKAVRPKQRVGSLKAVAIEPLRVELQPFEVLVFEATTVPGAKIYDGAAYRKRLAEGEAARVHAAKTTLEKGGAWEYEHQGQTYQRHFLPDGKAQLHIGGKPYSGWNGFKWRVEGDRLLVDTPNGDVEEHRLDDRGRLVLPPVLGGTARRIK